MKFFPLLLTAVLALPIISTRAQSDQKPAITTSAPRSWVTLKAATDQSRYTVGQPISIKLTATNTHKSGAYLRFTSGQRFDFSVFKTGTKDAVYTWSAARMFLQSTGFVWIKPGQSENFEAAIGDEMGQLAPGKYRLLAHLTNSPRAIAAAPIDFEIVDLGLAMTTRTNKTTYKVGEAVKIDLAVANRAGKANRVRFNSGMTFDVIIFDEAERQIWNYGANLRFAQSLRNVTWKKGETKKFSTTWNGAAFTGEDGNTELKLGRYRVQGVLQSTPKLYAPPVFIDIVG